MMVLLIKRIGFFIFALLIFQTVSAQIFYEDFSDNGFENWTPDGAGIDSWVATPTTFSGGEAPEVIMYGSPPFYGTARLISPVINTSDITEMSLTFLHFINAGAGGYTLSVETTSDGGETWNPAWELFWNTGTNITEVVSANIATSDVGSETFQFCFKFAEDSGLIAGWAFDNISLNEGLVLYNVGTTELSGLETSIYENDEVLISSVFENFGANTASFDVNLTITDESGIIFESTQSISDLTPGESQQIDFDGWIAIEGANYTASITTLLSGDQVPGNDAISQQFSVYPTDWFCIPTADCSFGDGLDIFTFAGIENFGSGCSNSGYGLFTDLTGNITAGETYTATMLSGWENQIVSIWVDFNLDNEFTNDERILTDYIITEPEVINEVDITIPAVIPSSNTTMRVGVSFSDDSSPDPCATFSYGEWEDYSLEVTGVAGVQEVTFRVTDPEGANYEGAVIQFFGETGTTDNQGTYTFTGVPSGTFPYIITVGNSDYYDVQGETTITGQNILTEIELLPNTDVIKNMVTIEEWTGTWCADCPAAANGLEEIVETDYNVGIIAYHNTDNYTTGNDIGRMADFYNRSWLPSVGFDGTFAPNCDGPFTENCFDVYEPYIQDQLAMKSPYEVSVNDVSLVNDLLSATIKVNYPGLTYSEDVRLLIAITESGIEDEWLGLSHLNFVERGMYPDYNGTTIELEQNEEMGITASFTLDPSWNPDNMEIIAFVQDFETKQIFNGARSEIVSTNLNEYSTTSKITLYPNPASDFLFIQSTDQIKSITVLNNLGQQLSTTSLIGDINFRLNTNHLIPGLYSIQIETTNGIYSKRIVIR